MRVVLVAVFATALLAGCAQGPDSQPNPSGASPASDSAATDPCLSGSGHMSHDAPVASGFLDATQLSRNVASAVGDEITTVPDPAPAALPTRGGLVWTTHDNATNAAGGVFYHGAPVRRIDMTAQLQGVLDAAGLPASRFTFSTQGPSAQAVQLFDGKPLQTVSLIVLPGGNQSRESLNVPQLHNVTPGLSSLAWDKAVAFAVKAAGCRLTNLGRAELVPDGGFSASSACGSKDVQFFVDSVVDRVVVCAPDQECPGQGGSATVTTRASVAVLVDAVTGAVAAADATIPC